MNDKIYVKDRVEFHKNKHKLDGLVFWRESLTDKTKVEIRIACYPKTTRLLIEALPD